MCRMENRGMRIGINGMTVSDGNEGQETTERVRMKNQKRNRE